MLSDKELGLLERGQVTRENAPGDVIFHEDDSCNGVYCLEAGLVGVRKSNAEGNSILLHLNNSGDTMAYCAFLAGEDYHASAEGLEPNRVCLIDVATVRTLLTQNPALGLRYLKRVSRNPGNSEGKILHNATLSVRARFAHLLTVLVDRYATGKDKRPIEFELPLSRHDLASMIGTTPEFMSRTIAKMEQDDIAVFSGRNVIIPELDDLFKEFEPEHFV